MFFLLKFPVAIKYLAPLSHCQKIIQLSSCLAAKRMSSLSLCLVYNVKQCQTNCLYSLSGWFYNLSSPGFWSCRCISFCWRAPNLRRKQLKSPPWRPGICCNTGLPALDMVEVIRVEQTRLWCQHLNCLLIQSCKDIHSASSRSLPCKNFIKSISFLNSKILRSKDPKIQWYSNLFNHQCHP